MRELKKLTPLSQVQPLQRTKITIDKSFVSEIELLSYSSSLCLFSMRLLYYEIQVKNRDATLQRVNNEILKLSNLLFKPNYHLHSNYTHKETKEFFKSVGLTPKHIKH